MIYAAAVLMLACGQSPEDLAAAAAFRQAVIAAQIQAINDRLAALPPVAVVDTVRLMPAAGPTCGITGCRCGCRAGDPCRCAARAAPPVVPAPLPPPTFIPPAMPTIYPAPQAIALPIMPRVSWLLPAPSAFRHTVYSAPAVSSGGC